MKKIDIGGNTYTPSTPSYLKQSVNIGENTYASGSFMDNYYPSSNSTSLGFGGYTSSGYPSSGSNYISPDREILRPEYTAEQKMEHMARSMICVGGSTAFGGFLGATIFPGVGAGPGAAFGATIGGFFCPGKDNNENRFKFGTGD